MCLDTGVGKVDVKHSYRYVGMAYHFLHDKGRRPGQNLVDSEGMPKIVKMTLLDPGLRQCLFKLLIPIPLVEQGIAITVIENKGTGSTKRSQ